MQRMALIDPLVLLTPQAWGDRVGCNVFSTWRLKENSTTLKRPVYAKWADFNASGTGESWPLMESCP